MEQNLFRYIWHHTRREQLWILFIVLVSMPTYFLFFDLPKQIVNGPIQGRGFETPGATTRFMEISFGVPTWIAADGRLDIFSGFELERIGYLIVMSIVFMVLVCINGLFKFYINTYKGRLGEQTLRRLRYELIDRIMRFPNAYVRRMKAPEAATMVKDEIEPLGAFIGDAFVQPVFVGGQALTAMIFIILQNVWLGLVAFTIVMAQAIIIPRMRHRLLVLNKQRQLVARNLAGRVGELVEGASEVHANDTSNYERADMSHRLGRIFAIRYELFQRKFFVKFLNNFLSQVTPFLFYLIGGYFAITGNMDIGQLVAVITAYKDLPAPIRDLINWDQRRLDVQIKYTQVIIQFTTDDLLDPEKQAVQPQSDATLSGTLATNNLSVVDDTGAQLLERVSVKIPVTQSTALLGEVNSGAESMSEVAAGLLLPTSGQIQIGDDNLNDLPETILGRRIGYVGADTYLRQTSLRDNLMYSLKHAPLNDKDYDAEGQKIRSQYVYNATISGNSTLDLNADWVDYRAAGVSDASEMSHRIFAILDKVDMAEDIFDLGLRGLLDPAKNPELAKRVVEARHLLRDKTAASDLAQLVDPFDPEKYNNQATIAENLLFGTAIGTQFAADNLAKNKYLLEVLAASGLDEALFDMGATIAATVIELFSDLPPDHPFFEQLSFMDADDIPEYEAILARIADIKFAKATAPDQAMILKIALGYIEPHHRLSQLDDSLRDKLLAARKTFAKGLPDDLKSAIEIYDPEKYNAASTLQDNILLGRVTYGIADGARRVNEEIQKILTELDLRHAVFEVGLEFNVGAGGKRLTLLQRQKVGLARALLKRPDILVINRIFSTLDGRRQAEIVDYVLSEAGSMDQGRQIGVFWVLPNAELAARFQHALVFQDGKLVEQGIPEALLKTAGPYARLVAET